MITRLLSLSTALALSLASGAMAQSARDRAIGQSTTPSIAASAVGRWLYDPQGDIVGSVRNLTDNGRTAIIMVGSYFRPGSYETSVPVSALSVVDGKITLQTNTVQALVVYSRG